MTDPIPIKDLLPVLLATIEAAHEAASSMSATCQRCGRHLDRLEGRIRERDYCHPDDPNLPDCYTITNHEQTFGAPLPSTAAELIDRALLAAATHPRNISQNSHPSSTDSAPALGSNAPRNPTPKDTP